MCAKSATLVVIYKAFFLLFALVLLTAHPGHAHGEFVYVSNYGDGTVSQFRITSNGTLTSLNPPIVKAYLRCHSLAADPKGLFLYVLSTLEFSRRNCLLSEFRIGSDGRLTPLSPQHIPLPGIPYLVTVDPTRPYLYVLNYGGSVSQFRIKANGTLAALWPPTANVISQGSFEYSVAFDPQNSVFYVAGQTRMTNEILGGISAFRAGKTGALHQVEQTLSNSGSLALGPYAPYPPQQVVTSHAGRDIYFLYEGFASYIKSPAAPAGDLEAVLVQYHSHASGKLRPLGVLNRVQYPGDPQEAVVDPKSRYCYLLLQPQYAEGYPVKTDKLIVARYTIRSSGSLGRCFQQTLAAPDGLFCPVFDAAGQTLYLLTQHGISVFHVSMNGSVIPLTNSPVSAGRGPLRMVCIRR